VEHAPSCRVAHELVVIDDASPELPMRELVEQFGERPAGIPVRVMRNPENLGFVGTVNKGLHLAPGDVVVLNSDTAVTEGWLDRLAEAAAPVDVATVTPLTSHGSICTLPASILEAFELESANPQIDECARFLREHSLRLLPDVITAVGFCMYVTRRALDLCGYLDEDTFGKGYGEEVDFCLRASRLGLRHVVEDSTFVYHRGGVSFGAAQLEGWNRSAALIDARYPFFRPNNTRERITDPLAVSFAALELALHPRDETRPHVLHILHSRLDATGGTEKYVAALLGTLEHEFDFSVLYPVESGFVLGTYWMVDGRRVENEFLVPGAASQVTRMNDEVARQALVTALDLFVFDAVHIHNLIGHSLAPFDALAGFPGRVVCSVHDMFLACPNFSLLYMKTDPCGIPDDLSVCARCLADIAVSPMPGSPPTPHISVEYLREFRAAIGERLGTIDHWVFPTQSAADYFLRVYAPDPERINIIEHGSVIRLGRRPTEPDDGLLRDEPLRVAFVGLGWAKKGLDAVNELAEAFRGTSVEIHHFGPLIQAASPELHAHGAYDNELLPELLHRAGIQIVLLPGAYAETFGIVMSEAMSAGIPVIGARYGALGERIRATGCGWTVDPMDPDGIRVVIERLDRARDELVRVTRQVLRVPLEMVDDTAPRYAELYRPR
jgi:GT2 family glycosyltransferase